MALTKVTMGLLSGLVDKITTTVVPLVKSMFSVSGEAPMFACRAWVNFDGTTSPPTIRASGNVSSVVRNGTGDYTVNFSDPMEDANYSGYVSAGADAVADMIGGLYGYSPTSVGVTVRNGTNSASNKLYVSVAVFR